MSRDEYLAYAKERALGYLMEGNLALGYAAFVVDLSMHDQTSGMLSQDDMICGAEAVMIGDPAVLRCWIEGFK